MHLQKNFCNWIMNFSSKTQLIEINLETIILKKRFVIRRIIIHPIKRFAKSIDQKSPKFIAFPEINRPVHRFHSFLLKFNFSKIENKICGFLVIDAIEKTNSSGWLLLFIFSADKNCDFPNSFANSIHKKISFAFSGTKKFIFFHIENLLDIFVKRSNIVWIVNEEFLRKIQKILNMVIGDDFYCLHFSKISFFCF